MPNRYIDREGIFDGESAKAVQTNNLTSMEKRNQALQEEIVMMKETNLQLSKDLRDLRQKYEDIFNCKNLLQVLISQSIKYDSTFIRNSQ